MGAAHEPASLDAFFAEVNLANGQDARLDEAVAADAFCATRLGSARGMTYGTLPPGTNLDAILDRAWANE